jgi:hypothetical protein
VSPFAADPVRTGQDAIPYNDARAGPGSDDDPEYDVRTRGGTVGRFRDSEAVGIVGDPNLPTERSLQILLKRLSDQPDRVGILDQSGCRRNRAGNPDPDTICGASLALQVGHQRRNGGDGGSIVIAGSRHTDSRARATPIEGDPFDLRPTKIDTESHAIDD